MNTKGINYTMLADCGNKRILRLFVKKNQPHDIVTNRLIRNLCTAHESYERHQYIDLGHSQECKMARKALKTAHKELKNHLRRI